MIKMYLLTRVTYTVDPTVIDFIAFKNKIYKSSRARAFSTKNETTRMVMGHKKFLLALKEFSFGWIEQDCK